jgi:transposase InsO family protein
MSYRNAKLTPVGRQLLVTRVLEEGWPAAHAAAMAGVSRATVYKWLHRYRTEGLAGLQDRSSRPQTSPRALSAHRIRRILRARMRLKQGPHRLARLLRLAPSTIYAVLRRHGLHRLRTLDRTTSKPIRYVRDCPGDLLHLDVKKLGRIPEGGGHRVHGRATTTPRGRRLGYEYLHVAVDDHSRVAFAQLLPDERGATCARFLQDAAAYFAARGVTVRRVMTDNARAYTDAVVFRQTITTLGATHKRTRPYRPQTNGKAERFIQTALTEWVYRRPYGTNDQRHAVLPRWLSRYNHHRPHTALRGRPPLAVLVNHVCGNYT